MKRVIILFVAFAGIVFCQDMIVRVYSPSWEVLKRVSPKYELDIAGARAGEWYDIVVDQDMLNNIIASGLSYEVVIHSIAALKEQVRASYLSYDQITDSLQQMVANYPSICKFDSLPITTYEGRWIYGIKISDNPDIEEDDEPGYLIDGQHHSREWACHVTVLFFADSILSSYGVVSEITDIINTTEIYCFPVINADGYVYDYPSGNMWRKNREPFGGSIGTDPNRNYPGCAPDIEGDWGAVDEGQASHRPSNTLFCGAYANSGDETRALTLYAKAHTINAYMTYHSYAEKLMWPWGWTGDPAPDNALYASVGNTMADMIQRLSSGTYGRGPIYSAIYPVSGSSLDWFYSWCHWVEGISNLSYTTELGTSFYQPVGDLDFIVRENFDALLYLADFCDSIVLLCEGVVPPPEIYPADTVFSDFTLYWHAKNSDDNHPEYWELVELSNPSIIEDDLESGTERWLPDGFTISTSQVHSGTHSYFSGNSNNMNHAVKTVWPYLVQSGDSVTFWCWYDLEDDYDVAVAEVSENTKEWFNLDTTRFTGSSGGWLRRAYSLEDWVGKSVYFRFRSMTDGGTLGSGFYVDDISPVCLFADVDTISSSITDTSYYFTSHPVGDFYYYVKGYNTIWDWGDYSCLELVFVHIPPTGPYLVQGSVVIDDAGANGQANPGEVVDLGIWVKNIGIDTALSVFGLLSESDPYVSLSIDSSWYGDVPEDDSALAVPYFQFTVADTCPNNHTVNFQLGLHDVSDSIWVLSPSIQVYAPVLVYQDVGVLNDDNSNGILDPGETGNLVVTLKNEGGAIAEAVTSTLSTDSPYIVINDASGAFGAIAPGVSVSNFGDPYTVTAMDTTPIGTDIGFELVVVSGVLVDTFAFSIDVGKNHYYLWNPDPTPAAGEQLDSLLAALGYGGDYGTTLPSDLSLYHAVFVCCGIYPNRYVIGSGSQEAATLVDFLENQEGRVYLEGGEVWFYDPLYQGGYDFGPLFGIDAVADGSGDLGPVLGEAGTFTHGMDFGYEGENNYIDHIDPTGTGFLVFEDGNNAYNCGVANDPGTYRTVGTSFELGLLTDGTAPSTRAVLLDSIMQFFGIGIPEEVVPPAAPSLTAVEKSGNDIRLIWNMVTTDTLGNPETMDCYVVYRDTTPSFVPGASDSIGMVSHPETTYVDSAVLTAGVDCYYLVKALDTQLNRSRKSNMGYVLQRAINENAGVTADRNWVTLPWQGGYATCSLLCADLSPHAEVFNKVTHLVDTTQAQLSYFWHAGLGQWLGTDFAILPGHFYEFNAVKDTIVVLVGANMPGVSRFLNENAGAIADRNWLGLAYNAAYSMVSDMTDELSPAGSAVNKVTNLDEVAQAYFSYFWHAGLGQWLGRILRLFRVMVMS